MPVTHQPPRSHRRQGCHRAYSGLPVLSARNKGFLAAGNKAELQAKLESARQAQGDLKAVIKQNDEDEWWFQISQSDPLAMGAGNTDEQQIYKKFRLEKRRQELQGDQKRLYRVVDEEEQRVNPPSPAAAAERQAIVAYAQSGEAFDVLELQDMIERYKAGDRSKHKRSARKKAQVSATNQAGAVDNQQAAAEGESQQKAPEPADPQDLSSYK